ncbi:MAG: isoaspartyl peptidase/L-asparaginase [Bacteroidota bacterium]|nr:isoaspartyl peptidase/L-asparaginase [Bacteroidota bacterium]MDP3146542.1 isoaspartyl peptidase/L-asparaginase [Bacteroidota bacterium]MDP3556760.1 isoaspartyl peptidase/L-asparaginase [Bacteroidota bacterium]
MRKFAIAIHGGAGTILRSSMTAEKELSYKKALEDAIVSGETILIKGGRSIDAIEAAIRTLEDNPLFNAGKGAVFTNEGKHEMDASVMNGKDLMAGAVAGIQNIKNPISLARNVMDKSEHVFMAGLGAQEFAKKINAEFMPDDYFFVQMRYDQLQQAKESDTMILDHTVDKARPDENPFGQEKKFGTVGCVAIDVHGNLAAGTSTGGMTNKKHGRVGDTPIIGAGTYANNKTCAISCTGHGEFFIRSVVAYDISCLMEYKGLSLKKACDIVVMDKLVKIGGEGGLIAIDNKGNIELPFNSEGMYRASKKEGEEMFIGIYKD